MQDDEHRDAASDLVRFTVENRGEHITIELAAGDEMHPLAASAHADVDADVRQVKGGSQCCFDWLARASLPRSRRAALRDKLLRSGWQATRTSSLSPSPMPVQTAHQMLRDATAQCHNRLDQIFSVFSLGNADGYGQFLQAHAAAAWPLEQALEQAGISQWLDDWPARRRTADLQADLDALQLQPAAQLSTNPLGSAAAAWGAAYVLEGSRLGGAVLARQVMPGLPTAYLRGSVQTKAWPRFLHALDTALNTAEQRDEAVAAARQAFALFETAAQRQQGALPA